MKGAAVELLACETCGGNNLRDGLGRTRGMQLFDALNGARDPHDERVKVSTVRCLWACKQSCAVHVRGPQRVGYVLANFEPTEESARALLDYMRMYADSADGAVPFKQWPQALRGHFLCRTPVVSHEADARSAEPSEREENA